MTVTPGVIIDGALPRSNYERAVAVFDYLITMPDSVMDDKTEALDPGHKWQAAFGDLDHADSEAQEDSLWVELEDEILAEINERLPDDFVCTLGEFTPGDVIVREVGPDDHYMVD